MTDDRLRRLILPALAPFIGQGQSANDAADAVMAVIVEHRGGVDD